MFVDESGFYLLPGLVKTYSPSGLTPVVYHWHSRDHLSVMTGLTLRGRLTVHVQEQAINADDCARFLRRLLQRSSGRWLMIWDGSPIHRGWQVKDVLANGAARRVHLERLPPYAPELNPVEGMWHQLKHVELRNHVCLNLPQLRQALALAFARLRRRTSLLRGFFMGAGLL